MFIEQYELNIEIYFGFKGLEYFFIFYFFVPMNSKGTFFFQNYSRILYCFTMHFDSLD